MKFNSTFSLFFSRYLSGIFIAAIFILNAIPVLAQRKCGFDQAIADALKHNPKLIIQLQKLEKTIPLHHNNALFSRTGVVMIPVVVHIVLQNPNSITNAQVVSQINVLNEDYTASNPDTSAVEPVWKPLIGDAQMEFCLAKRTPDGNPTNGIDRVATTKTLFSIDNAAATVKHVSTGGANAWDDMQYLNIWVCNLESGFLGVTTPAGLYPDNEQGVVIQYNAFGTIGSLDATYDEGKTTTHEIGHFFGLYHTFGGGDGSCSPGDFVADTPPQSEAVYGCPPFPKLDSCSPVSPGIMLPNFMGYVDDDCMHIFTKGQVARMENILMGSRSSLLFSNGCVPVILKKRDAYLFRITSPSGKLCSPDFSPEITLKNYGDDTLHSVNITYETEDSIVHQYQWTGTLATLDTVSVSLPPISTSIGNHTLTVYSDNPNDSTDEQPANDTSKINFHLDPVSTSDFTEGFESPDFPPQYWQVINPDGSFTWERTTDASHSGIASAVMHNLDYQQNGQVDDLVTPVINVSTADSAFAFFDVAAAVQSDPNGNNQYWDTLEVLISKDCGQSYTMLYQRWGKNLITHTAPTSQEFIPTANEWRRDSINLTPYIHDGNFQLVFRNITNFENNIYLDDINIATREINPYLKEQGILVVPNPTSGTILVEFLQVPPDLKGINIYNSIGQLIATKAASAITNNSASFDLSHQPAGIYFVKIVFAKNNIVKKIVKIK